jgi:hypothetical protein
VADNGDKIQVEMAKLWEEQISDAFGELRLCTISRALQKISTVLKTSEFREELAEFTKLN